MKEIVVISGKGGTGKTSITASFAYLEGESIVVADCDVDAADMHLLLQPDFKIARDFYSGELAVIDQDACIYCGKCEAVCRFDAIPVENGIYTVDPVSCEGCGYCSRVCPVDAITNIDLLVGEYYVSTIKTKATMVHARLGIAADNSGKLVAQVKNSAREVAQQENKELIIVDGSPGIGCPVVSSLTGAHYVVLVAEPSLSGLHDLKRVHELVKIFKIGVGCIINKSDINPEITEDIKTFLKDEDITFISSLPYDESFTESMTMGKVIMEDENENIKEILKNSWEKIKELTNNKSE